MTYKSGLCILHGQSPFSDPSLLVVGDMTTMVIENGCQVMDDALTTFLRDDEEVEPFEVAGKYFETKLCSDAT